jgi:hypothetical protein
MSQIKYYDQITGQWQAAAISSPAIAVESYIPQILIEDNEHHYLEIGDAGKHYYSNVNGWYYLFVPDNNSTPFPIGTFIDIVTGENNWIYITANDSLITSINVPGLTYAPWGYDIPPRSTARLIKVENERWMLSGYGIEID